MASLDADGHHVHCVTTWSDVATCLAVDDPDLAVVGIRRADAIGRVRRGFSGPLVFFGASTDARHRVEIFRIGADDVVPSPLSLEELVVRVQAVARRFDVGDGNGDDAHDQQLLICGPLAANVAIQQLRIRGTWTQLPRFEFLLIAFLMRHARVTFSRRDLLRRVWGYEIGDVSTVSVHVRRLRQRIEQDPTRPALIRTVWGSGYYFDSSAEHVGS